MTTEIEAQQMHDRNGHPKNTGVASWLDCTTERCHEMRRTLGVEIYEECPTCGHMGWHRTDKPWRDAVQVATRELMPGFAEQVKTRVAELMRERIGDTEENAQ